MKELDEKFQALGWRDTTEAYYGLDFTPFMSVVEEVIADIKGEREGGVMAKGVSRKRKYDNGGDIDIYGNKAELPLSNHQMKNYVIDKTGISSGTYINGKYYDTWDKIATDLGFMREENGWIKVFPSRIYTRQRKY